MPWCPKCNTEYRDGFTTCADCNETLVESLEASNNNDYNEVIALEDEAIAKKFVEFLSYSNITAYFEYLENNSAYSVFVSHNNLSKAKRCFEAFYSVELEKMNENESPDSYVLNEEPSQDFYEDSNEDSVSDGLNMEDSQDTSFVESEKEHDKKIKMQDYYTDYDNSDVDDHKEENSTKYTESKDFNTSRDNAKHLTDVTTPAYVKKADQLSELKSTAATFLLFGFGGFIFLGLNIAGIFSFIQGPFPIGVMSAMFLGFIYVGFNSITRSKKAAAEAILEDELTNKINSWLDQNISQSFIKDTKDESLSNEINFIKITDELKEMIVKNFGEIDDSYLDTIVEEYYNNYFENI